jgi:class 3 adenylate cyclase/tetratricopeptide (TPR) repeat protein
MALTCPKCRSELPAGAKFCLECGAPVTSQTTAEARFASPESYTPRHLAEKILTSKSALEGERKQVTVLFADLKGSMELLADRDPEEARKILDPVLELMMEAVHRYEGTVNQVMGDGIMALFGAPLAHEDHAVRACYAALKMLDAITRYGSEMQRSHGVPVMIRVGLNSGDVVVRAIGSDLRIDYTAVGQTTHLAARMEQTARPGSALMTADTLRLVEGYVGVKPLGPVNVKGLPEPIEVYEVSGAGPVRTRLQASVARGLTRFVGRDEEIEALRRAFDQARGGHGQIVAVVGEPGVGKSRLFYEFMRGHRTEGSLVLQSSSMSYGKATAYSPVIDVLRAYCQIDSRDELRTVRERVAGKILMLDRGLEPVIPAVLGLLDALPETDAFAAVDPVLRGQRTRDGIKTILLRESRVQPLVLVFEDLHWIDSETQALLDSLVESLPAAAILLLVNYRPEYRHGWSSKTYYRQIRIDPLPSVGAEELLDGLLGNESDLRALKRLLIERTDGNPLFLEESVRTLVETQVLGGKEGAYRLLRGVHGIQVPATVQAVLAARIDRLPPDEKRLLQSAAVIGTDVPFALLQGVAELPEDALRRVLAALQAAEFLYETRLFPDLEYTFKHALTHDVAYEGVLHERRRVLHARIVDAMESTYGGRLTEHVERLAHHAFRGEVWEKAATYSWEAGVKAFTRSANTEAVIFYEQALAAIGHLRQTPETVARVIDLNFDIRNALMQTGRQHEVVLNRLREAEALALVLGDRRRLGRALDYLSNFLANAGELTEAVAHAERAETIAVDLNDVDLGVAARFHRGSADYALGHYRGGAELLKTMIASLQGSAERERYGLAVPAALLGRVWLAWCLAELGEFTEAQRRAHEAMRLAEISNRALDLSYAYRVVGFVPLLQGAVHEAIPPLEHGLALSESADLAIGIPYYAASLGYAYLLAGRTPEATSLLERASRNARGHIIRLLSGCLVWLAEAYLHAGRTPEAAEAANEALSEARKRRQRGDEAYALRMHGDVAAHGESSDWDRAETHYREALALATELGMRPLIAHCHLGLGKLYQRTGKREQAQEHLTTATTMYCEMGMQFWLEKTEKELGELR